MKETMRMAVMAIAFWWLGLTAAPGAEPMSEIVKVGLIGTVAAVAGFAIVAYLRREKPRPVVHQQG